MAGQKTSPVALKNLLRKMVRIFWFTGENRGYGPWAMIFVDQQIERPLNESSMFWVAYLDV